MPILVDSHCHLDMLDLEALGMDLSGVIKAAAEQDVKHILSICVDMENAPVVKGIAEQFEQVYASIGKHPCETEGHEPTVDDLLLAADHPKVIAIGETGLDYYRSEPDEDMTWQHQRFVHHIQAAKQLELPLIIHTRSAREDTVRLLDEQSAGPGVFHCFTESWEMAKAGLDMGLYISFSGILTFKNAEELREVARKVPLERILVETDAPYLTPVPYRGKLNRPGYTHYVAQCLAELKGVSYQKICQATTDNFSELFSVEIH